MKISTKMALTLIVLLAAASGLAKITLMPQEVVFFAAFGFSNNVLIAFGVLQVLGAVLLLLPNSRVFGLALIGVTFVASAVVLFSAGKLAMAVVTLLFVGLLGFLWSRFRLTR